MYADYAPVFLSPARRRRGILVAPGFCPSSRFFLWAQKLTSQFILKFEILKFKITSQFILKF